MADRQVPRIEADERETLLAFLDHLRSAMLLKLDGLTEEQAREPGVPSGTSLLWLVKHLTAAESRWVRHVLLGEPEEDMPPDELIDLDTIVSVAAAYRTAAAEHDKLLRAAGELDGRAVNARHSIVPTLRWILVHLVEETARHAGHADILRERIDGLTGR